MDLTKYLLPALTVIIALSGWGKVLYDYVETKPKIKGQVFQVMRGQMDDPRFPGKQLASFITYLYLVNQRRNTIHVLDYELEIEVQGKWHKLERVYGIHRVPNINFKDPTGQEIKISNFSDNLIYRKASPVGYGSPLHGWIVFAGDLQFHSAEISKYKLTCIDAFTGRHEIVTTSGKLANLYLLQDLADVQIPKPALRGNP